MCSLSLFLFLSLCSIPSFSSPFLSSLPVWKGLGLGVDSMVWRVFRLTMPSPRAAQALRPGRWTPPPLPPPKPERRFLAAFPQPSFLQGVLGGEALRGKSCEAPLCFLRWQRIGGWGGGGLGRGGRIYFLLFLFLLVRISGVSMTPKAGALCLANPEGRNPAPTVCERPLSRARAPLSPGAARLGSWRESTPCTPLTLPTRSLPGNGKNVLGTCSFPSAQGYGRYFSSSPRHLPTSIPGFEKEIPSPPPQSLGAVKLTEGRVHTLLGTAEESSSLMTTLPPSALTLLVVKDTKGSLRRGRQNAARTDLVSGFLPLC